MKKKMFPKVWDPPAAMSDGQGNLITSDKSIEERALKVYTERLKRNTIQEHLKSYESEFNRLCKTRLKITKEKQTDPWTMNELDTLSKI